MTPCHVVVRLLGGLALAMAASALCGAAAAGAQTRAIALGPAGGLGGPVFAGSQIVWTEGGQRLMSFGGSGARQLEHYDDAAVAMVPMAEGENVAVYRERINCPEVKQAHCAVFEFTFGEVRAGTLGGGTTPLVSCSGAWVECARGGLSVGAAATGWHAGDRGPTREPAYRMLGPGVDWSLARGSGYAAVEASQAGDYLGLLKAAEAGASASPGATVFDARSGTPVYGVDTPVKRVDVRADGLMVGVAPGNVLFWASAAEPQPHTIVALGDPRDGVDVKVRGESVAVQTGKIDESSTFRLQHDLLNPTLSVFRLSGEPVAQVRQVAPVTGAGTVAQEDRHWDFDGANLLWAVRPCVRTTIVEWDLTGTPPNRGSICARPRVRRAGIRIVRPNRVRIPLSCPAAALAGCGTQVYGSLRDGRRRFDALAFSPAGIEFSLDPGRTRTLEAPLTRLARRWLSHHRDARLELSFEHYATALPPRTLLKPHWPSWIVLPFARRSAAR